MRAARIVVANKVNVVGVEAVDACVREVRELSGCACIVRMESLEHVDEPERILGRRVLAIDDGPSLTHGGMAEGVAARAARLLGGTLVDPRPDAVGSIAHAFAQYPHIGAVLPALGYGARQSNDLARTIAKVACDTVLLGTRAPLDALITIDKPVAHAGFHARDRAASARAGSLRQAVCNRLDLMRRICAYIAKGGGMHPFVRLSTLLIMGAIAPPALAQYPNRPIRLVIPFPGGGGPVGVSVRVVQMIHGAIGQQIVADNRPGADGALAADIVLKSAPDGYTLFFGTNTAMSALPHMRKVAPFDPATAFAPIAMIGRYTFFLYTHPTLPVKSVPELIAYARANPGKLTYASGNSTGLTMMAQFLLVNRLEMVNVNYKGDMAVIGDMASGRVQLMFGSSAIAPLAKEGRVRALAVMLPQRSPLLPEAVPAADAGLGNVTISAWGGVFGPAKVSRAIVERLNREINAVLPRADVRDMFDVGGVAVAPMTPEQLGTHVKEQLELWGKTMRAAGIEPM